MSDSAGPIRVVVFSSGPVMTHDARRFLCRLESEPAIQLMAVFCQAESTSMGGVIGDLWKRRGLLAVPLFVLFVWREAWRFIRHPMAEARLQRQLGLLAERIHYVTDIHHPEVIDRLRGLAPDLGLIYGSPILQPQLFEIPHNGTLGIHHGKVPEYRGNKTTFWAMFNDERVAGVTIQKIEAGLDTGMIIREATVPIGRRSRGTVWRDLERLGMQIYIDAILAVRDGTAHPRPQRGIKGRLYRNPTPGDLLRFYANRLKKRWNWAVQRNSGDSATRSARP